jgi:hypothetical protein
MNNLRILDVLEIQKILPESYSSKLKLLNMRENDYPLISLDSIEDFLIDRLKAEIKEEERDGEIKEITKSKAEYHSGYEYIVSTKWVERKVSKIFKKVNIIEKGTWDYVWDEKPLEEYCGNPPEYILDSALKAKELGYKKLFVVTVNADVIEDPLLIAIKEGKRYLINWWDKDINSDEIIKLCENKK